MLFKSTPNMEAIRMLAVGALLANVDADELSEQGCVLTSPDSIACTIIAAHAEEIEGYHAFEVAFNVALELGARLALDPLGEHDLSALLRGAKAEIARFTIEDADHRESERRIEAGVAD